MMIMSQNKAAIGGFPNIEHWTSTEDSATRAYTIETTNSSINIDPKGVILPFRCVRKDAAGGGSVTCNIACGGSNMPTIGDSCTDGSIYMGISPDGNKCMYTHDSSGTTLAFLSSSVTVEPALDDNDGDKNTSDLVADSHSHPAATYCDTKSEHGRDDWYLPAVNEAEVVGFNYGELSHLLNATADIWSSTTTATVGNAFKVEQADNAPPSIVEETTNTVLDIRCVRKDSSECAVTCGGTNSPALGDTCADGTIYIGQNITGKCRYLQTASYPPDSAWAVSSGTFIGSASITDGQANSAAIIADPLSHPAADACEALTAHGHSNWYLPALNTLEDIDALGTTGLTGSYWSSTEADAWVASGTQLGSALQFHADKALTTAKVLCIRADP